ncbi:MAG TPA: hypothetical protein GYA08_03960 [Chloroflexi bacterium]|nr:hypothetical protein [Chloroflexota bacterium]
MTTHTTTYDAYLLRIWQEPAEDRAPPTCYFLLEQLFDARQRWLFTDPAELQKHLQSMITSLTIGEAGNYASEALPTSSDAFFSANNKEPS